MVISKLIAWKNSSPPIHPLQTTTGVEVVERQQDKITWPINILKFPGMLPVIFIYQQISVAKCKKSELHKLLINHVNSH